MVTTISCDTVRLVKLLVDDDLEVVVAGVAKECAAEDLAVDAEWEEEV